MPSLQNHAVLSSAPGLTVFRFRDYVIRFRAPYSLERYTAVKEWDKGYLVAMAKYAHNAEPEEEYIDLVPILSDLYFDANTFLEPISEVRVENE